MPRIIARRASRCAARGCALPISKGENIEFTAADGPRHIECATLPARRRNEKPARCARCGRMCARGEAALTLVEREEQGRFHKTWLAACAAGCQTTERGTRQ